MWRGSSWGSEATAPYAPALELCDSHWPRHNGSMGPGRRAAIAIGLALIAAFPFFTLVLPRLVMGYK